MLRACPFSWPGLVLWLLPQPLSLPEFQTDKEISRGKARDFRSIYPPHIQPLVWVTFGFWTTTRPRPPVGCLMRFVYLGPELCIQLPPHLPSRHRARRASKRVEDDGATCSPVAVRTCCSARSSRHLDLQRTFTSKSLPSPLSLAGYLLPVSVTAYRLIPANSAGLGATRHARRT